MTGTTSSVLASVCRHPIPSSVSSVSPCHRELSLSDDMTVTVTELACLEKGCAPVETVIGLLRPDAPQLQCKLHKPMDAVDAKDLVRVCTAWGFDVQIAVLEPLT